ncbi:MAG: pyridoxine 5'-phosphate oxidase C-terminal domain-containing protein [Galbitalea sp.]
MPGASREKRDSTKGRQLSAHPAAALTFYWREQLRSVRIRGPIAEAAEADSHHDFTARSLDARAIALSGEQSAPLVSQGELVRDVEASRNELHDDADLVPSTWTVWELHPAEVEFWEGSKTRLHTRLRYERTADGWLTSHRRP